MDGCSRHGVFGHLHYHQLQWVDDIDGSINQLGGQVDTHSKMCRRLLCFEHQRGVATKVAGVTRKQRHEDTQIVDYVSDAVIKQQQKSLVEQLSYGPCTGNRTGTGTPSDHLSAGCCRSQPGRDTFNNQSAALAVGCNGKPMISLHHSQ